MATSAAQAANSRERHDGLHTGGKVVGQSVKLTILLLALLLGELAHAADDDGIAFYREVLAIGRECAKGKNSTKAVACYVKASPAKCKAQAYEALAQRNTASRRAWAYCIASCVDASYWSRTLGACSRELK